MWFSARNLCGLFRSSGVSKQTNSNNAGPSSCFFSLILLLSIVQVFLHCGDRKHFLELCSNCYGFETNLGDVLSAVWGFWKLFGACKAKGPGVWTSVIMVQNPGSTTKNCPAFTPCIISRSLFNQLTLASYILTSCFGFPHGCGFDADKRPCCAELGRFKWRIKGLLWTFTAPESLVTVQYNPQSAFVSAGDANIKHNKSKSAVQGDCPFQQWEKQCFKQWAQTTEIGVQFLQDELSGNSD